MAQRTVALCDGKFIGIESIYTVIDGKQINIPDKLEQLRAKSRNNELLELLKQVVIVKKVEFTFIIKI